MSTNNRVIWSEGLFLRPHHFQQAERFLENWVESRVGQGHFCDYGYSRLELDQEALNIGKVCIKSAHGIMPDGTPFRMPGDTPAPAPLDIGHDSRDTLVILALPYRRPGMPEFALERNQSSGLARYIGNDATVEDAVSEIVMSSGDAHIVCTLRNFHDDSD